VSARSIWPRALPLLLTLALSLTLGCARSPAERLRDEGLALLDDVIGLLEAHRGDEEGAREALRAFVEARRDAARRNAREGREALKAMPAEQRAAFERAAAEQVRQRLERIRALVQGYDRRADLLSLIAALTH